MKEKESFACYKTKRDREIVITYCLHMSMCVQQATFQWITRDSPARTICPAPTSLTPPSRGECLQRLRQASKNAEEFDLGIFNPNATAL